MTRLRAIPAALLIAGACLLLASCQGEVQRPPCPAGQKCLEFGNNTEPATVDPQKSELVDEYAVIGDLFMGLTTDSPTAEPLPGMATSWETSPDGLVWTFHLREAAWSDGTPVTADDFVYAYRRILAPETAATYAYLVFLLKNGEAVNAGKAAPETLGARALGPRTLQLTLAHPAPYLPEMLKHQSFYPVPRHVIAKWGDAWTRPEHIVSNGPFKLAAWRLGDRLTVVKNPRFWDAANVCLDRVNFYPTPDTVSAERRVDRGELDLNTRFQSNRIERLRQKIPAYVRTHVSLATSYASLNTRDRTEFRDKRVRRALSMAVDREFMTQKLMRAGQTPAYAFVPPGVANYKPGAMLDWARTPAPYERRQQEARRLLAEAGFGPNNPLTFSIKTSSSPDSMQLAEALQSDWNALGAKVSIIQNEGQVMFAAFRARDFDVGLMTWYADYNDAVTFLDLLRSTTGAQNYGDYKNPAYDGLLDAANLEPDGAKRADLLSRAEQTLLSDEALIPIYFVVSRNLVSPRVTGFVDNTENFHRIRWMCMK